MRSDEELRRISGFRGSFHACGSWHSPKVHTFGSVIYSRDTDRYYEEEPYRNIEVVDRIGSGDAYISGVLYGLLSEPGNYQRALEYGNATSAVKNTIPGDLPSSVLDEIESIIQAHNQLDRSWR